MIYSLVSVICLYTLPLHVLFKKNFTEVSVAIYLLSISIIALFISSVFLLMNNFLHNIDLTFNVLFFVYFILTILNKNYNKKSKKTWAFILVLFLFFFLVLDIFIFPKFRIFSLVNIFVKHSLVAVTLLILVDLINSVKAFKLICSKNEEFLNNEVYNFSKNDRPDVYHIILDSHTGFDDNRFDNSEFKSELCKRGFKIIHGAKCNYNFTHLSVPSILNFDYLENLIKDSWHNQFKSYSYYFINRLHLFFAKLGYECNILSHYHFKPLPKLSNNRISYDYLVNFTHLPLAKMLLFYLQNFFKFNYYDYVTNLKEINSLAKFSKIKISEKPMYNFIHFLAPHEPFLFDGENRPVKKKYWNNLSYFEDYQKGINKRVITLIDDILENMKPNSIIIIHSDHGSPCFDKNRYSTLLTVYDKEDKLKLNDNILLVNLFRIVLNNLFGTDLKSLEAKYYHYNWQSGNINSVDFLAESYINAENKDGYFI